MVNKSNIERVINSGVWHISSSNFKKYKKASLSSELDDLGYVIFGNTLIRLYGSDSFYDDTPFCIDYDVYVPSVCKDEYSLADVQEMFPSDNNKLSTQEFKKILQTLYREVNCGIIERTRVNSSSLDNFKKAITIQLLDDNVIFPNDIQQYQHLKETQKGLFFTIIKYSIAHQCFIDLFSDVLKIDNPLSNIDINLFDFNLADLFDT